MSSNDPVMTFSEYIFMLQNIPRLSLLSSPPTHSFLYNTLVQSRSVSCVRESVQCTTESSRKISYSLLQYESKFSKCNNIHHYTSKKRTSFPLSWDIITLKGYSSFLYIHTHTNDVETGNRIQKCVYINFCLSFSVYFFHPHYPLVFTAHWILHGMRSGWGYFITTLDKLQCKLVACSFSIFEEWKHTKLHV